jgi:sodium-coupled neutral amino acid transporter 11
VKEMRCIHTNSLWSTGLPYSLKASGCLTGLGLLIGIALLTDWTIRLIVLNAKLSGQLTYIDIMDHCFGRNGRTAVSIFQGAFAFGGMCAFIVSVPDNAANKVSISHTRFSVS